MQASNELFQRRENGRKVERSLSDLHLLLRRRRKLSGLWRNKRQGGELSRVEEQGRCDGMLATTCDNGIACDKTKATTIVQSGTTSVDRTERNGRLPRPPTKRHTLASMNGLDEDKIKVSGGDGGGKWYSSFLDKKRKALNLLGSVRRSTRERDKDLGRVSYVETLRDSAASSPVSGRRSRSGSDPHNHLMAVRPGGLQTSTGFTPRDELSTSLTVPPTTAAVAYPVSQYGSWTNLRTANYDKLDEEDIVLKQVRSIRKVKSLPRSVLCSPVTSRRRPHSQWITDTTDNISLSTNSSPRSVVTPISGSRENFTTSLTCESTVEQTPYHSASLTRSSSLPVDGEDSLDQLRVMPLGSIDSEEDPRSLNSGSVRLSLRSQSFNTHMQSLNVKHTHEKDMSAMREHVVRFLLETEQSYVNSLQTISEYYSEVLSAPDAVDCVSLSVVLEQVPAMICFHKGFAREVEERLRDWNNHQCLGDLFLSTFTQKALVDAYSNFIQHFLRAKAAIALAKHTSPALARALEQQARVCRGRLSFNDLIIKPVQRIPRYMLFIKDILKHTNQSHPDHAHLEDALEELTALAERVNEAERQSSLFNLQQELLIMVDGLAECLTPNSVLVRHDTITEIVRGNRKERALMLFSDVVVCASTRRKSGGFKRNSLININSVQPDHSHHRVKWFCSLSSVTITQSQVSLFERRRYNALDKIVDKLQKDEEALQQMLLLSSSLHSQHHEVTSSVQELLAVVRGNLVSRKREMETLAQDSARVDLNCQEGSVPVRHVLIFPAQKSRQIWEQDLCSSQQILRSHKYCQQTPTMESSPSGSSIGSVPRVICHVNLPGLRSSCQLSAIAVSSDSLQMYVCSSTSNSGRVTILRSTAPGSTPRLVANVPITHSSILCAACISVAPPSAADHFVNGKNSNGSLETSFHEAEEEDDDRERLFLFSTETQDHSNAQSSSPLLRSDSAPPTTAVPLTPPHPPSILLHLPPSPAPSTPECMPVISETAPRHQLWLWLGTEGGIMYMVQVTGGGALQLTTMITVDLGTRVLFITDHHGRVFVGLADGRMAVFNPSIGMHSPELMIVVDSAPITSSTLLHDQLLIASKTSITQCSSSLTCKELISLPPHLCIGTMVVVDSFIFVAVEDSLTVLAYSTNEAGEYTSVASINCSECVTAAIQKNDAFRQQKYNHIHIVTMTAISKMLVLGTSIGLLVAVPLPSAALSPLPLVLPCSHGGSVQTLLSLQTESGSLLISGGKGMVRGGEHRSSDSCCVVVWSS